MKPIRDAFEMTYEGSRIVYGRGSIERLGETLAEHDLERALVVCGSNVGANEQLMDPIRDGLGKRLVDIFDETTPAKSVETVYDGIEALRAAEPDVIVGVGGGSSLDTARQISVFAADGRSLSAVRTAAREGRLEPPNPDKPEVPVIGVPTTLAGADISAGGSIEILPPEDSPTGQPIRTNGQVTPLAIFYDPALFETTPTSALAGSAMNGFNKGIERIYDDDSTAATDAVAMYGLQLLSETLPKLDDAESDAIDRTVAGIILVQMNRRLSIIHAFGHGFSRTYSMQQGVAHAIIAPPVLRYVFDEIDGCRRLLAEGLGIDATSMSDDEVADAVVDEVTAITDDMNLPQRLRAVESVDRADFPAIAEYVHDDVFMQYAPTGLDPSVEDIEAVLHDAW